MKIRSVFVMLGLAFFLQAQTPDSVVSPEIKPDGQVTFRMFAPKATDVSFYGDFMPVGTQQKMTKDASGVWSVTVGPLPPSIYIYSFTVDGATIADPRESAHQIAGAYIRQPGRGSGRLAARVAGTRRAARDGRDQLAEIESDQWRDALVLGLHARPVMRKKRAGATRFSTCSTDRTTPRAAGTLAGNANFILDNLQAENKAVPMIVVMPFGHAVPFTAPTVGTG